MQEADILNVRMASRRVKANSLKPLLQRKPPHVRLLTGEGPGQHPREVVFREALNPLHAFVLAALALRQHIEAAFPTKSKYLAELDLPYSDSSEDILVRKTPCGEIVYGSKELAGVAGLFYALDESKFAVRYTNDLCHTIHGIDAIAYDACRDRIVLCEAKATGERAIRSFSSYLKLTARKGYQLSNKWCWRSFMDLSLFDGTAGVFLNFLEPFLSGRVERLLCVTRVKRVVGGYKILEKRIWSEDALQKVRWLAEPYDLSRQRKWLAEIVKAKIDFRDH